MSKKSHHFLTLWPWPLTYDLEKLIRSGHYHCQCVYQIWEQSIPWFLSYRVNTIAGGGRLQRKTITSPDPLDTGDIMIIMNWWLMYLWSLWNRGLLFFMIDNQKDTLLTIVTRELNDIISRNMKLLWLDLVEYQSKRSKLLKPLNDTKERWVG